MVVTGEKINCCKGIMDYSCDTALLLGGCFIDKNNNISNENNCNFSNKDLIMIITDAATRKIVNVNDAACKFYGYSKEEILSKYINDINKVPIDETYERTSKIRDNTQKRFIVQHSTASGEIRDVEVYSNILNLGDQELVHSIVFDITEKIKHEKELKESKERYKKLVQLSPHAVMVHTEDKFIFVNKAGANLLEVSHRKELIGISIKDFIQEEYKHNLLKQIDFIKSTNNPVIGREMKIVTSTSKVVDVSMSSSRIQYDGQDAIMTILTDITQRKETERLIKKAEENKKKMDEMMEYDKIKTEFLANISHELKTPINVILGSLQLADKYEDDFISNPYKFQKLVRTMKQNCFRLLRLINNLIDITKIDSGYFNINLQNADIVKVIEDITLSVANYIENKGVELIFDTNVEEKIMAFDPEKLERILLNLLSNALKFTSKEDRIEVNIFDKGNEIVIEVKDTGIGIPNEQQAIIFDRFIQVDKSLTRDNEGSGIGLSLVKSLVEMHQGKITLESKYGEGSNFIIKIPSNIIVEDNESNIQQSVQNNKYEDITIEKVRIEFSDIYNI